MTRRPALAAAAILAFAARLTLLPGCPFRALAGIPCPGCGMTRATLLLLQGRLGEALALQPLVPVLAIGLALALVPSRGLVRRLRRDALAGVALASVLGVWLGRLAGVGV